MDEISGIKKNLMYQTIYQILNTSLPLITSPYLARVLGATQQGIFSYTQSIVNYFSIIAMLGVVDYGTRTIASCISNKEKRSNEFWNIYALQWIVSMVAIVAYIGYIWLICRDNVVISILQGFYLLGEWVNINWVFFGVEKFEITVKRNMIIRLASVGTILFFVKTVNDLWIYTFIMAGGSFLSNAVLWFYLPQIIDIKAYKNIRFQEIKKHVKPNLLLFIPIIAMSIYHIMDKTMLGILSTYKQGGLYYNADKVINIPIGIIYGVGTVMLPRISAMVESGKTRESKKLFDLSLEMIAALSISMAFGIAAISKEFTPLFFGQEFNECILLIMMLSPVLIIKSFSLTARTQYLIPAHKENIYIQSVFCGALVNLIVNLLLIPQYGAFGAIIGTLVAEGVACLWQYIRMMKYIDCKGVLIKSMIYLLFGIIMFITIRVIVKDLPSGIVGIIIEIFVGGIVYGGLCLFFWVITKNHTFLSILKTKGDKHIY